MAFANPNYSDILATTIESRSRALADNVTSNNALLARLKARGKIKTFSGGHKILQELTFAENANAGWYSGYDLLPVGVSDVISAAEYDIKQAAVPIIISGLEQLQNAGREQMIDLMEGRLEVAESTMMNLISAGIYSDGTGAGGKEIDGLEAAVPMDPTAAAYGGIDGGTFAFWTNYVKNDANADTMLASANNVYANTCRGQDKVDIIPCDNVYWEAHVAALQSDQRFSNTNEADGGFTSIKFMTADLVLDGGLYKTSAAANGGVTGAVGAPTGTAFFLNTNYLFYRPHARRNMVSLSPTRRYATNQDAEVQILGWAGNLTCSGRMFQGRHDINAP